MPTFTPPHFAADKAGCPTCFLELVPHPAGGRFICPRCRYERATLHLPSTRPQVAAVLKVMTETLATIRHEGAQPVDEQTTPTDHEAPAELADSQASKARSDPSADSAFVTIEDLTQRWNLTENGARSRLQRREIAIGRDDLGRPAVREADLAGHDWGQRQPRHESGGNGHAAPAEPVTPAEPFLLAVQRRHDAEESTRPAESAATPNRPRAEPDGLRGLLPSQEYQLAMKGSSERVARLRRALGTIAEVAHLGEGHVLLTIKVLAEYVLEVDG